MIVSQHNYLRTYFDRRSTAHMLPRILRLVDISVVDEFLYGFWKRYQVYPVASGLLLKKAWRYQTKYEPNSQWFRWIIREFKIARKRPKNRPRRRSPKKIWNFVCRWLNKKIKLLPKLPNPRRKHPYIMQRERKIKFIHLFFFPSLKCIDVFF